MKTRLLLILSAFTLAAQTSFAASASSDFAYRHVTLHVESADAQPLAKASIYGFCRDLNLLWPRCDAEAAGRDDVL